MKKANDKMQWEKVYKDKGESYQYYDILKNPHPDLDKVISIFKKQGVKRVLDLGCGAGRNSFHLAKKGFDVYGIDISPTGLKILKKALKTKGLSAHLTIGDVFEKLPYKDNFFDALISVQVL